MNKRQGFTLIELLVVVLIMGILASVAMPQYFKSVEKSRATEAVDTLSSIASSQERAYMQKGTYVTALADLDVGISNLSYFTVDGNIGTTAKMKRTVNAGGGLQEYQITLTLPGTPGTGARSWDCSPTTAGCKSMLPM
ncbi:MAG: pilin [Elusimicrobiales bacterium]|nr:pilin [Elusimicrobiales bacterium]